MKDFIIKLLQEKGEMSVAQILELTTVSRQYLHRQIKELLQQGIIQKLGSPPHTFYRIKQIPRSEDSLTIPGNQIDFLKQHFIWITELGERLEGLDAMRAWCARHQLPLEKTIAEFISTKKKYLKYFLDMGVVSGLQKIASTKGFIKVGLDELYYSDFYAIERFGKTKLGLLLHIGKQTQNLGIIREVAGMIKSDISRILQHHNISAVGFIPPSIKREIQFMQVLEYSLAISLPAIHLLKAKGEIIIPQKSISKLEERIENAKASIMVMERRSFENVLLIDDAVGSGASLNETAIKLKERGIANKVIGYAVTGSFKGFDVIQEV